jgi:hypothetical protein
MIPFMFIGSRPKKPQYGFVPDWTHGRPQNPHIEASTSPGEAVYRFSDGTTAKDYPDPDSSHSIQTKFIRQS